LQRGLRGLEAYLRGFGRLGEWSIFAASSLFLIIQGLLKQILDEKNNPRNIKGGTFGHKFLGLKG